MGYIGLGLLFGLAAGGVGIGLGLAGHGATNAMARQPEMQGRIFTTFIIAASMAEALALIGFVLVLVLMGRVG